MRPAIQDPDFTLYAGDSRDVLRELPEASVDCIVTSPPYWSLRKYPVPDVVWESPSSRANCPDGDHTWGGEDVEAVHTQFNAGFNERWGQGAGQRKQEKQRPKTVSHGRLCLRCGAWFGQLGLEPTPELYVSHLVDVLREAKRVLSPRGVLWLNIGDCYTSGNRANRDEDEEGPGGRGMDWRPETPQGLHPKELVGVPWMAAFALRADGWRWRAENVWWKPNAMPESTRDRPSRAHEALLMFTLKGKYWYDRHAAVEPAEWARWGTQTVPKYEGSDTKTGWMKPATPAELKKKASVHRSSIPGGRSLDAEPQLTKNLRSVWPIVTVPFSVEGLGLEEDDEHYAAFPEELPRRCVALTCPERVCTVCGHAPERLTRKDADGRLRRRSKAGIGHQHSREAHGREAVVDREFREGVTYETVGWTVCGHGSWRTGVVLDPFLGTGTTALAARGLVRHTVGIDASGNYVRVADRRTQQQSLLAEAGG